MKNSAISILVCSILFLSAIILSCNNPTINQQKEVNRNDSTDAASVIIKESIPDSTLQFLITSAAQDFHLHHPPTAIDFRNVKAGYIASPNEKMYLICGEFLSQEKKEWESFTTIRTSGYEQYLGDNMYCHKAVFILGNKDDLSLELKNKFIALGK